MAGGSGLNPKAPAAPQKSRAEGPNGILGLRPVRAQMNRQVHAAWVICYGAEMSALAEVLESVVNGRLKAIEVSLQIDTVPTGPRPA